MNRFMKQIAVVAVALTTAGVVAPTQAIAERGHDQAGRALATVHILLNSNSDRHVRSSPRHTTRSYGRTRGRSDVFINHRLRNHHASRHRSRHSNRRHHGHHSYYRH